MNATHSRRARTFVLASILMACALPAWGQQALDCDTQLLGSSQTGELFAVDLGSGAGSLISTMPAGLATEIEYDLAAGILYADETNGGPNLHSIDIPTGASTGSVMHAFGALTGMEFANGNLYGTFIPGPGASSDLVIVDTGTGGFTTVGATGFGPISGLAYDDGTGTMYGITAGGSTAQLLTIDLSTGAGTVVGSTNYEFIGSIEFGPDGVLYAGTASGGGLMPGASPTKIIQPNTLLTIDTATGAASVVGSVGFSVTGLTACATAPLIDEPTPVPVFSGAPVLALGGLLALIGLVSIRRSAG